jgi:hypothetical protein
MHQLIFSLLIVCIILLIIYNTQYGTQLKDKCNNTAGYIADAILDMSRDPEDVYQETKGDFYDLKAKMALKKYLTIPENKRTAMDNYKIGNIYRYHVKNPELTHHYYRIALKQMRKAPSTGNIQMLDRMDDYEVRNVHIDHDIPEIRELIAEDLMIRQIEELGDVVMPRRVETTIGGPKLTEVLQNVKITDDDSRSQFFKKMTNWTSDTQNVHDSHVTDDVERSYSKIVAELPPLVDPEIEIKNFITEMKEQKEKGIITDKTYENAIITIKNMKQHTYSKINDSERNILANVIRRGKISENQKNREGLTTALATNLSNAVERNNITNMPVCISGRVSGAISSLAYMDKDPDVGILKTKEAIRNEVFDTAHHEYTVVQKEALNGSNEKLKRGASDTKNGEDSPESDEFESLVKDRIRERLTKDYTKHLKPDELETLISQANMAF